MCPILDGYRVMGIFKFPYTPLCEPRLASWQVMYCTQLGVLSFALQPLFLPPDSPTQLQTGQFPYFDTWKVFKECGEGGVGGYLPGQCILHDSATTTRSKKFRKGVGDRSDSVECLLVQYVFSFRRVRYVQLQRMKI